VPWLLLSAAPLSLASFVPRPFSAYPSSPVPGGPPASGLRRYRHRELYNLEDGSDFELRWEVDADPKTILALDLEDPHEGVRLLSCSPTTLTLEVPDQRLSDHPDWKHITASRERHGCEHLEYSLYHRILNVPEATNTNSRPGKTHLTFSTEELPDVTHIFPHMIMSFGANPRAVKDEELKAGHEVEHWRDEEAEESRRLSSAINTEYTGGHVDWTGSLQPDSNADHNSMFNFAGPELSKLSWNWDYEANTTRNPQFKYLFPGGVGWMRLYKPYLQADIRVNMTFQSHMESITDPPQVAVDSVIKGFAKFKTDVATAVNFKTDKSAAVLDNLMNMLPLEGLENITNQNGEFMKPLRLHVAGTPVMVQPGFSCQLKGYHIGLLKGTMRVGFSGTVLLDGLIKFDTRFGVMNNITAKALDMSFTPPTWMLFTNKFEMGMMFAPTVWIRGDYGDLKNMEAGVAVRPFFNVSIIQKNAVLGGDMLQEVAIYPWRAVGLPQGKAYSIRISANGERKTTTCHFSTGIVEWADRVEDFHFGALRKNDFLNSSIFIEILEDGREPAVAAGHFKCPAVSNGECNPSPTVVELEVGDKKVSVQMSILWTEDALNVLQNKVRSMSVHFPSVSIQSPTLTQTLADPAEQMVTQLAFTRNGHQFVVPLIPKMKSGQFMESAVVLELGPLFVDAWKSNSLFRPLNFSATKGSIEHDVSCPFIEFMLLEKKVAAGYVPQIPWDQAGADVKHDSIDIMSDDLSKQVTPIQVMTPIYQNGMMAGSVQMEIDVMPAGMSAFWIFPYQTQDLQAGGNYEYLWTTVGASPGTTYPFTLTTQIVHPDGTLTPTSWQKSVKVACKERPEVEVYRYHSGDNLCIFGANVVMPSEFNDKRTAITALWVDANMMPHEMVAEPVTFSTAASAAAAEAEGTNTVPGQQSGRFLSDNDDSNSNGQSSNGANNNGKSSVVARDGSLFGFESKGATDSDEFGSKVHEKLDKLKAQCSTQDLSYAFGGGVNMVEHMKNAAPVVLGMSNSDPGSGSTWSSEPLTLFRIGSDPAHAEKLKKLLPESVCAGGACEGMMPGCQKTRVNPIFVKQIVFEYSRSFKWQDNMGPKVRHIIAYGLALLPAAIQISEQEINTVAEAHGNLATKALNAIMGVNATPVTVPKGTPPPAEDTPRAEIAAAGGAPFQPSFSDDEGFEVRTVNDQPGASTQPAITAAPASPGPSPMPMPFPQPQTTAAPLAPAPAAPATTRAPVAPMTFPPSSTAAPAVEETTAPVATMAPPSMTTAAPTETLAPWMAPPAPDAPEPAAPDLFASSADAPAPAPAPIAQAPTPQAPGATSPNMPSAPSPGEASPPRLLAAGERHATSQHDELWLKDIDGPDSLDGDVDKEHDRFTVTIVKPMDYELTEDFIQGLINRDAFRGIQDGREGELGPVRIKSFYMKDPPKVELPLRYQMVPAIGDAEADESALSGKWALQGLVSKSTASQESLKGQQGALLLVAGAIAAATLVASVAVGLHTRRRRASCSDVLLAADIPRRVRLGYTAVEPPTMPATAV